MAAGASAPWDVAAATRNCSVRPWTGFVWRCHTRRYAGEDAAGSLLSTGRFNRGSDQFPIGETWPALYTALGQHIALGERLRHTTPESLKKLAAQRMSCLHVELQAVLDLCASTGCTDLGIDGFDYTELCQPARYEKCHELAQHARGIAEAILVPSCTKFPEGNLIIFPDRLRESSTIAVENVHDPDLYIDWAAIGERNSWQ